MKNLIWIYLFYLFIACSKSKTTNELPKESIESIFPVNRTYKDSALLVTKQELIYLIKKANSIVKNKEIEDFSDDEHILMMMLLNTKGVFIPKENNINLNSEISKFSDSLNAMKYAKKVGEIYEWIPNRGMGMYFLKLDIDYGGGKTFGSSCFELK